MGAENGSSHTPRRQGNQLHLVIGWDQSSREAVRILLGLGSEVVIVTAERPDDVPNGARMIEGSPEASDVLQRAGIGEAASVVVALPAPEARRAMAAAKALNPTARIVVSVHEPGTARDFLAAGAHAAIDPEAEVAREMVRLMLEGNDRDGAR